MADILILLLCLALSIGSFRWHTNRRDRKAGMRPSVRRRLVRISAATTFGLFSWFILESVGTAAYAQICIVCGNAHVKTELLGIHFFSESIRPPKIYGLYASTFPEWFAKNVGVQHDHQWHQYGHGRYYGGFACAARESYGDLYFGSLPQLPDQVLAIRMASQLANAPPERRRVLADAFEYGARDRTRSDGSPCPQGQSEPWIVFAWHDDRDRPTDDAFKTQLASWLECHPEWKE